MKGGWGYSTYNIEGVWGHASKKFWDQFLCHEIFNEYH